MSTPSAMRGREPQAYRNYVWQSMLDGEMNDRYWRFQAARYSKREKAVKIFLAITSSGTVAGWALWRGAPLVWQVLSAVSALLALALPVLDFTGQVERASDLRERWWGLTAEYSRLWAEIELDSADSISQRIQALKSKETDMVKIEAKYFSRDEALIHKCQDQVLNARGLSQGK
jgi:hypothetical protein